MKIGIIIPDKNDRKDLLLNCQRMLKTCLDELHFRMEISEVIVELVNDKSPYEGCDITWRYKLGYDRLRNKNLDAIFLIENDDWYSKDYLVEMIKSWIYFGKPDIFGTNYTIYYHIKKFAYFTMHHEDRSSAMSTLIKPDLNFEWCVDHEPYTDLHLWNVIKSKKVYHPENHICIGIKHGIGLCGGRSHTDRLERYDNFGTSDAGKDFLRAFLDKESFDFYSNYFQNHINEPAKQDIASINL